MPSQPFAARYLQMLSVKQRFIIQPALWVLLAFSVIIVPVGWIVAWILAVCVHELGHILACKICNVRIDWIEVGLCGARINTEGMSAPKQIVCSLAGPLCGCCLILLLKSYPKAAMCAIIQTIFNLLPIQGTDGGCILQTGMLLLLGEEKGNRLYSIIEKFTRILLFFLLFYIAIKWSFGALIFIWCVHRMRKAGIKIPCKPRTLRVQ